jgi:hypothetical protein
MAVSVSANIFSGLALSLLRYSVTSCYACIILDSSEEFYMTCKTCNGDGIIYRQEHFGSDSYCPECNGSGDSANPSEPQRYVAGFVDLDPAEDDYHANRFFQAEELYR